MPKAAQPALPTGWRSRGRRGGYRYRYRYSTVVMTPHPCTLCCVPLSAAGTGTGPTGHYQYWYRYRYTGTGTHSAPSIPVLRRACAPRLRDTCCPFRRRNGTGTGSLPVPVSCTTTAPCPAPQDRRTGTGTGRWPQMCAPRSRSDTARGSRPTAASPPAWRALVANRMRGAPRCRPTAASAGTPACPFPTAVALGQRRPHVCTRRRPARCP